MDMNFCGQPSVMATRAAPGPTEPLHASGDSAGNDAPISLLESLIAEYGDVVRFHTTFGTSLLVNHPPMVKEVVCNQKYVRNRLLKSVLGNGVLSSDGDYWEQQRRLMLPLFKPQQIRRMVGTFRQVVEQRCRLCDLQWLDSDAVDLTREMHRIALCNIGRTLFGTDFDDTFLDAFDVIMRETAAIQNASVFGIPLIRRPDTVQRNRQANEVVEATAQGLVQSTTLDGPYRGLLEILRAHGADGRSTRLTNQQLRDEILTIITAGHETTAVTLCWMLHLLAAHPEVAERFHRELDVVLSGRPITATDVPKLEYTRMILNETLRLYPPVWFVARTVEGDTDLFGYPVPANTGVLFSPYMLHRHPEFWDEPDQFNPDRFACGGPPPEPYSYIPFLAGRHLCIGKHFALVEILVVIANLGQRYRFHLAGSRTPGLDAVLSLRMHGGLWLRLERRREV